MAGDEGKTWQSPLSFNGQNYDTWAKNMKTICMENDLWEFVINGFNDITNLAQYATLTNVQKTHLKESRRKDAKALSLTEVAMVDTVFPKIAASNYAKEAWDILKTDFQGTNKVCVVKLQNIRREFENLQMKENELVADFSSRTSNLINQIKSNGEDYQEQRIVEKILRSLPHKYDNFVMTIEEENDLTRLTMDELMGILQTHEHKINRSTTSSSQEKAFKAQSNPRGSGRGRNSLGKNSRG